MKSIDILRVTLEYRGACRIPQGEYLADDPALNGLASTLLRNGHAVVIGQMTVEPSTEVSTSVDVPAPVNTPANPSATKKPTRKRRT